MTYYHETQSQHNILTAQPNPHTNTMHTALYRVKVWPPTKPQTIHGPVASCLKQMWENVSLLISSKLWLIFHCYKWLYYLNSENTSISWKQHIHLIIDSRKTRKTNPAVFSRIEKSVASNKNIYFIALIIKYINFIFQYNHTLLRLRPCLEHCQDSSAHGIHWNTGELWVIMNHNYLL